MAFRIEVVQLDLMHPEQFLYQVMTGDVLVVEFATEDEANDFIEANGGSRVQAVGRWVKDVSATAGSTYR